MKHAFDGKHYVLLFNKGERVVEGLHEFARERNIQSAWVKGLGGLAWAELGFYDLNVQEYNWTKFDEQLELTNLTGNIAWKDNEPVLHLHATVSDVSMHAHGGHLQEAEVNGTVEIMVHAIGGKLTRKHDNNTGLNLLDI